MSKPCDVAGHWNLEADVTGIKRPEREKTHKQSITEAARPCRRRDCLQLPSNLSLETLSDSTSMLLELSSGRT